MRRGQSVVEYMLVLSFLSIAIAGVMYAFQNTIVENVTNTSNNMANNTLVTAPMQ